MSQAAPKQFLTNVGRDAPTDRDTPRAHSPLRPPPPRHTRLCLSAEPPPPFAVSMRVFAYDAPTGTW